MVAVNVLWRPVRPPLPPGSAAPLVATRPMLCLNCEGTLFEPDDEQVRCCRCQGAGWETRADFRLPASRADEVREVTYVPRCSTAGAAAGALTVRTAAKETHKRCVAAYQVHEFRADGCRAFAVAKAGAPDRCHNVEIGPDGVRCDCEGHTYLTSAKHNQRAWEAGGEVFPGTYGCKHADALVALLNAGWFDL